MTQHNLTQILKVIRDLVMRNRPCYRDYLGNGQYKTKLLPEYLLPDFLRKNVVASKAEVQSAAAKATTAADAASNAQAEAERAQITATTATNTANTAKSTADNAKTTADAAQADASGAKIMSEMVTNSTNVVFKNKELLSSGFYDADGTRYWTFPSSAVLIGSQITFQHPGGKASGIWNGKKLTLKVPSYGGEERTVIFSLRPTGWGMIIKIPDPAWSTNLGLYYSWTEVVYWKNNDDIGTAAIIPDYAIASGIRLISTTGNKQFHLTVDDTGTLKATEVT